MAWKKVCAAGDVATDSLRKFDVDGVPVLIVNVGGEYIAIPPLCPHMAEPLELSGVCGDTMLTCTKHLWQWDIPSGREAGMAEKPLLLYPIERRGDELHVDIERELAYDYDD